MAAVRHGPASDPYPTLEQGNVLAIPDAPMGLSAEDLEILRTVRLDSSHKNISYHPADGEVSGLAGVPSADRRSVRAALGRFSKAAVEFAAGILPRYSQEWRVELASLRPQEEAGRDLPFTQRNDLLHTDAFPRRPTRGGLILRVFYNFHPLQPRVWMTSDPFARLAGRYAWDAGLGQVGGASIGERIGAMLRRLRRGPSRSAYDEFMLGFHDYLKGHAEFQSAAPKQRLEFAPGTAWMAFTDITPHAVVSGQFALEQTLIVARHSLAEPECAPIAILEKMAGRRLS